MDSTQDSLVSPMSPSAGPQRGRFLRERAPEEHDSGYDHAARHRNSEGKWADGIALGIDGANFDIRRLPHKEAQSIATAAPTFAV